jgi:cytochrome P450
VLETVDKSLIAADSDQFDVVQDFPGPFPVEVITRMAGVPEEYRQQVRHWIDISLHREPARAEAGEAGMQANIESAMYYFSLVQQRREAPQDDMISRLIAAEIPARTASCESSTISQSPVVQCFWAVPAPRQSPSWSAPRR